MRMNNKGEMRQVWIWARDNRVSIFIIASSAFAYQSCAINWIKGILLDYIFFAVFAAHYVTVSSHCFTLEKDYVTKYYDK
jgi:hypothetical protein